MTAETVLDSVATTDLDSSGNSRGVDPSVSVVICAYTLRRWDDIVAAVDSVVGQSCDAAEILLVIDHHEQLREQAARHFSQTSRYDRVRVLPNSDRQGLSGARNTGVIAARGDVVAFLDDDAQAASSWIETLLGHYRDPAVVGVGGSAEPVWPDRRPEWLPREFDWVVGCSYVGQPTQVAAVRNFIGCNMSLRRHAFEAVGGFSYGIGRVGRTPLGCEETELCIRVHQQLPGAQLRYDPAMAVRHRVTEDRARPAYFLRRCYSEGLSKAVVSRLVGAADGLSSERNYVSTVLPRGVGRGFIDLLRLSTPRVPRWSGPLRSLAIVVGLAATSAGYASAGIRARLGLVHTATEAPSTIEPRRNQGWASPRSA